MLQKLGMIKESVKQDENNQYEVDLYEKLQGNIKQAEKMILVTFDGE